MFTNKILAWITIWALSMSSFPASTFANNTLLDNERKTCQNSELRSKALRSYTIKGDDVYVVTSEWGIGVGSGYKEMIYKNGVSISEYGAYSQIDTENAPRDIIIKFAWDKIIINWFNKFIEGEDIIQSLDYTKSLWPRTYSIENWEVKKDGVVIFTLENYEPGESLTSWESKNDLYVLNIVRGTAYVYKNEKIIKSFSVQTQNFSTLGAWSYEFIEKSTNNDIYYASDDTLYKNDTVFGAIQSEPYPAQDILSFPGYNADTKEVTVNGKTYNSDGYNSIIIHWDDVYLYGKGKEEFDRNYGVPMLKIKRFYYLKEFVFLDYKLFFVV